MRYLPYFALFSTLLLPISEAFAVISTSESFVETDLYKVELTGDSIGGQYGASIASADLNNDGFGDLIVGAPFASGDNRTWNGKVSVVFGRDRSVVRRIDLADEDNQVNFWGENSGDQFGSSLATGDFNGDGNDDIVVGAHNAYESRQRAGKAYVFYGRVDNSGQRVDISASDADLELSGSSGGDQYSLGLASYDVNFDGFDDLLVGSPQADAVSTNSGVVYLYLGSKSGLSSGVDAVYYGQISDQKFGSKVGVGNFDGTGLKVAISAYRASAGSSDLVSQAGKVYLFDVDGGSPKSSLEGIFDSQWFGFDFDISDINSDGYDDLAVGSFPYPLKENKGRVSIFLGGEGFGENDMQDNGDDRDVLIDRGHAEAMIGASVVLDDFNGDTAVDIAAGAPGIAYNSSSEAGDAYVVYGPSFDQEYQPEQYKVDAVIHGAEANDWFGYKMQSIDFNGDGVRDLAVGSRYSDAENGVNNGKVFVMLGRDEAFGKSKTILEPEDQKVSRGEFVNMVVDKMNVKDTHANELESCMEHREFCLFNFSATSLYKELDIEGDPIKLYPDIEPESEYYDAVNTATMLGIVNGFAGEEDSPFGPERKVSRIQALKVILSTADLVKPQYRFELVSQLGGEDQLIGQKSYFEDIDPKISYMWWYPRYVNFAVEAGIIDESQYFRPDEEVRLGEVEEMIEKTLQFIENEKARSSADIEEEALSVSSEEKET